MGIRIAQPTAAPPPPPVDWLRFALWRFIVVTGVSLTESLPFLSSRLVAGDSPHETIHIYDEIVVKLVDIIDRIRENIPVHSGTRPEGELEFRIHKLKLKGVLRQNESSST